MSTWYRGKEPVSGHPLSAACGHSVRRPWSLLSAAGSEPSVQNCRPEELAPLLSAWSPPRIVPCGLLRETRTQTAGSHPSCGMRWEGSSEGGAPSRGLAWSEERAERGLPRERRSALEAAPAGPAFQRPLITAISRPSLVPARWAPPEFS